MAALPLQKKAGFLSPRQLRSLRGCSISAIRMSASLRPRTASLPFFCSISTFLLSFRFSRPSLSRRALVSLRSRSMFRWSPSHAQPVLLSQSFASFCRVSYGISWPPRCLRIFLPGLRGIGVSDRNPFHDTPPLQRTLEFQMYRFQWQQQFAASHIRHSVTVVPVRLVLPEDRMWIWMPWRE